MEGRQRHEGVHHHRQFYGIVWHCCSSKTHIYSCPFKFERYDIFVHRSITWAISEASEAPHCGGENAVPPFTTATGKICFKLYTSAPSRNTILWFRYFVVFGRSHGDDARRPCCRSTWFQKVQELVLDKIQAASKKFSVKNVEELVQ